LTKNKDLCNASNLYTAMGGNENKQFGGKTSFMYMGWWGGGWAGVE